MSGWSSKIQQKTKSFLWKPIKLVFYSRIYRKMYEQEENEEQEI